MDKYQDEFADKYLGKLVRPLGKVYKIPIKDYIVTAALLNWEKEDTVTVFAIQGTDYSTQTNKHWFTLKINKENLVEHMRDFELIDIKTPITIKETIYSI